MDKRNSQRGFTVVELVLVIFIVGFVFMGVLVCGVGLAGNQWFTESGALRELQVDHPTAAKVMKSERNVFADSRITVLEKGKSVVYCLNSNILFNYTFESCD